MFVSHRLCRGDSPYLYLSGGSFAQLILFTRVVQRQGLGYTSRGRLKSGGLALTAEGVVALFTADAGFAISQRLQHLGGEDIANRQSSRVSGEVHVGNNLSVLIHIRLIIAVPPSTCLAASL